MPDALRAWWRHTGGRGTWVTLRAPKASHGREEVRLLWALADPYLNREAGRHGVHRASWPHLQQVCRVERRRTVYAHGRTTHEVEVSYAITSFPPDRADARTLLAYLRGHWRIENTLHSVRDVTFDEDCSQTRTGAAPQLMAAIRNLALALLRRAGHANIAAALRTYAGRAHHAVGLVLSPPPP
ncbi:MAG TPA: ISAs1 family transposase [Chloroflexota bacterium]|nr:ISAs1 family transposase [Chloroflexota bacterium]